MLLIKSYLWRPGNWDSVCFWGSTVEEREPEAERSIKQECLIFRYMTQCRHSGPCVLALSGPYVLCLLACPCGLCGSVVLKRNFPGHHIIPLIGCLASSSNVKSSGSCRWGPSQKCNSHGDGLIWLNYAGRLLVMLVAAGTKREKRAHFGIQCVHLFCLLIAPVCYS